MAREAWTELEVRAAVQSYFSMLERELSGIPYVKAHENAALREIVQRSASSIEFKHQNISAVLMELGWIPIRGYAPAVNYQRLLRDVVVQELEHATNLDALSRSATPPDAEIADQVHLVDFDPAPSLTIEIGTWEPRTHGARRDYLLRDERNARLGIAGEAAALRFERSRLIALDRPDLATRVEHASVTRGDGLGYDIRSFDGDGRERYIEVKTTRHARETPFFATINEVRASEYFGQQYSVYRLFRFSDAPGMFHLPGPISASCALDPTEFRAVPSSRGATSATSVSE